MRVMFYIRVMVLWLSEMGCSRMRGRESSAVTEVLGLALVLMIVTGAIGVLLFWGVPFMQDQKSFVALESTLLQLDAMGDLMDDVFSEGAFYDDTNSKLFGSSKTMSFTLGGGEMYLDEQGTRFVFWYSVVNGFDFDVSGFDPSDGGYIDNEFSITINAGSATEVDVFYLYDGSSDPANPLAISNPITTGQSLKDAVQIDVKDAGIIVGRICLFDAGSLVYEASSPTTIYRAIVENGGVLSTSDDISRYFFNEPKNWSQTLLGPLDEHFPLNTDFMLTLRILQIKKDPSSEVEAVSGTGSTRMKLWMKSDSSTTMENKTPIFNELKMSIYGDEAVVSAWRFFYIRRMGFQGEVSDFNIPLSWSPSANNVLFSFNHAVCYLSMEV